MPSRLVWLAPTAFVLLWSTGFIFAKYGLPHAEPFTFLAIRFALVAAILLLISLVMRAPWPRTGWLWLHIAIAGVLAHGIYLGGVFAGMATGVNAGISAILVGVQPLLTAVLVGPLLGERVTSRQWVGLVLGLAGIALVVSRSFNATAIQQGITLAGFGWHMVALFGMTFGVIYQKRFCSNMDLRTGSCIQFAAAAIVVTVIALGFETNSIQWTPKFILALTWMVIVLSLGAMTLLWLLVARGAASNVASLFYLVPPTTAIIAWFMFSERLTLASMTGMVVVAVAVALVNMPVPGRR